MSIDGRKWKVDYATKVAPAFPPCCAVLRFMLPMRSWDAVEDDSSETVSSQSQMQTWLIIDACCEGMKVYRPDSTSMSCRMT